MLETLLPRFTALPFMPCLTQIVLTATPVTHILIHFSLVSVKLAAMLTEMWQDPFCSASRALSMRIIGSRRENETRLNVYVMKGPGGRKCSPRSTPSTMRLHRSCYTRWSQVEIEEHHHTISRRVRWLANAGIGRRLVPVFGILQNMIRLAEFSSLNR